MKQRLGFVAWSLFGLVSACTAQVGNSGDALYEMNAGGSAGAHSGGAASFGGTGVAGAFTSGGSPGAAGASIVGGAGFPGSAGSSSGGSGGASSGGNGLSCDLNRILQNNCMACHGVQPALSLLSSRDALLKQSIEQPNLRVIDVALSRIQQNAALPMPPAPAPRLPASDVAIISQWVNGGTPAQSCGAMGTGGTGAGGASGAGGAGGALGSGGSAGAVSNPYNTPLTCTSNKHWTGGDKGSSDMHPGGACMTCHKMHSGAPVFAVAGTVFPSAHEPIDCDGANGSTLGLQAIITDANGGVHTLNVAASGNFNFKSSGIPLPYQAKIVSQNGKVRAMATPQMVGDCNSCHTQDGANMAPGRIMAPQ